jgi:hypothetical protein
MKKIIVLWGEPRHGKKTVGWLLANRLGGRFASTPPAVDKEIHAPGTGFVVVSDGRYLQRPELWEEARVMNILVYRPGFYAARPRTWGWRLAHFLAGLVGVRVRLMRQSEHEVYLARRRFYAGDRRDFDAAIWNDGDLGKLTRGTTLLAAEVLGWRWRA